MIIHNPILTGSFTVNGTDVASITSSAASLTSLNAYTASQNNRNGTYATTGSNTFAGIQTVNSNLVVTGSITAQTLVVQTITSSVDFVTGSTRFGSVIGNTHVFTGSMSVSGSVGITGTLTLNSAANSIRSGNELRFYRADNGIYTQLYDGGSANGFVLDNRNGDGFSFQTAGTNQLRISSTGAAIFSSSVTASGGKSQFVASGGASSGAGISLNTGLSGSDRRNWFVGTEENIAGDFVIKCSTAAGLNGIDGNTRFAILNNGNVGIATSDPKTKLQINDSGVGAYTMLTIHNRQARAAGVGARINLLPNSDFTAGVDTGAAISAVNSSGNVNNDTNLIFETSSTGTGSEKMRITSGGFVKASNIGTYLGAASSYHEFNSNVAGTAALVIRNTSASPAGPDVYFTASPNNTTSAFLYCADGTEGKFVVWSNGDVDSRTNSYGGWSDIKLKENITDTTPKLDDLLKVKIKNYNFIGDDKKQLGVIAQELEEIFPALISETPDYEMDKETGVKVYLGTSTKSVKYSVFVPMLIKAIQELQAQINELKNK
jgi:hypothetical protein